MIKNSGKCGKDLVWTLYKNGTLTIPDGVKHIEWRAFRDYRSLTTHCRNSS